MCKIFEARHTLKYLKGEPTLYPAITFLIVFSKLRVCIKIRSLVAVLSFSSSLRTLRPSLFHDFGNTGSSVLDTNTIALGDGNEPFYALTLRHFILAHRSFSCAYISRWVHARCARRSPMINVTVFPGFFSSRGRSATFQEGCSFPRREAMRINVCVYRMSHMTCPPRTISKMCLTRKHFSRGKLNDAVQHVPCWNHFF